MRDLAMRALDTARVRGAGYADVRVVRLKSESIVVRNHNVEALSSDESLGFGVRVIAGGYWGFAASRRMTLDEADSVAAEAVRIARASATVRGPRADIGPPRRSTGTYRTPVERDPFAVPLDDKIALLVGAGETMLRVPNIIAAEGTLVWQREQKLFTSSEGAFVEQELVETGCGLEATAVDEGEVQNRSYPGSGMHQGSEGWEFVERYDLAGNAGRIAEEAAELLRAPTMQPGTTTVILDSSQVALQIHESCGHPVELDRALGTEAAFAGTSFLTPDRLGSFMYGSPIVNLTADATIPGGLGTFGFDDEGVPAQRAPIVREGRFVGYLTSRETSAALGQLSNGAMRASGWNRIPLIRMTNVSLEPGEWTLADMVADTDDGVYMESNRSWSIDDRRLNFQFGTQIGREIKHGKLSALIKNATYTGITPRFWGSCDAIANRDAWVVWGIPNCGKGQPEQVAHTGHGAAPARFRNVQVGLMK
ncbi:MAG: TldD/PmbA family protein [Dehalococcoidia bacterium]|nr:MAG: TldD/PmbA family protein [Dehalococcoidia bacterium]